MLLCAHSTHLFLDYFFTSADMALMFAGMGLQLNNTVHCTHGQLFELHCAADYQSVEEPSELKINRNFKAKIIAT